MIMKIRTWFNSDAVIVRFPFLAKYTSKYGSLFVDIKSLIHYYIFGVGKLRAPSFDKLMVGKLLVMPTTICNGNCVFCAYKYFKDEKKIMPFELFKKIIDDYSANGGKSVDLTPAQGEPLTDPGILEKIGFLYECYTS